MLLLLQCIERTHEHEFSLQLDLLGRSSGRGHSRRIRSEEDERRRRRFPLSSDGKVKKRESNSLSREERLYTARKNCIPRIIVTRQLRIYIHTCRSRIVTPRVVISCCDVLQSFRRRKDPSRSEFRGITFHKRGYSRL